MRALVMLQGGRTHSQSRQALAALLVCLLAGCGGLEGTTRSAVQDGAPASTSAAPDAADDGPLGAGPGRTIDAGADMAPDAPSDIQGDSGANSVPEGGSRDAPSGTSTDASLPRDGTKVPPTVLVSNAYNARSIAVDDANVYFSALSQISSDDAIYQVPKNTLGATPIELSSNDRQPLSLASDGTYVYWNDTLPPAAVRRIIIGGNGATTLADIGVIRMALSPTSLFWVSSAEAQSMPKAGGTPTPLGMAPMGSAYGVAIDDSYFYFATTSSSFSSTISRIPQSGGAVTTLATVTTNVTLLATDGTNVYFIDGDYLSAVPAAGGPVSVLASGYTGTSMLKVDSGNLYAAMSQGNGPNGSILRVPVAGGRPTLLASAQWDPFDIALDANFIYWTTFASQTGPGAVMVASK